MSVTRTCLVCTALSNYAHYGVDCCRRGNGQCTINPKDRHNCRGCRFTKCASLGMQLETKESLPALPSASQESLLTLISREHSKSIARRRVIESTLHPTSLHRRVRADIEGEELLLCTWTHLMDYYKLCSAECAHFAAACFPEFAALSKEDQELMLRTFSVRLFNAEVHCDTFRRFGCQDGQFSMATQTTCYDTSNFEFITEHESPTLCNVIAMSMLHYHYRIARLVGPILKRSQFTETEMTAIFALSVWWIDPNQSLPEHIVSLARKVRRSIVDALKRYYELELPREHSSVRLGNLVTFEHTVQEIPIVLGESMQFLRISGLNTEEPAFLEEFDKLSF